ncbi:MAG: PIN domain-containing protein [Solirubrobacteraceae bacterium]
MTRTAADSSVAIPALLVDHADHANAELALGETDVTVAHAALETYSVLTRLPPPLRVDTSRAGALIEVRLPNDWISLDPAGHAEALRSLAAEGIAGGAVYDGLIALTAAQHDAELLTLDRRASRTYRRLGVRFLLLDG